ncbi:PqqD family protein [Granulicella paludicola]|uniref:PqqD family protein n=1 Tax=Granulicella paludicola TaxID=474951 RepID=UPI0021E00F18|nr:PqqD family protein [Granulicella paludicola]
MSNPLPRRRTLQLSIQQVGQETLIYDEQTHKAYCLNPVAAAIWSCCDGATTAAVIAAAASLALAMPVTEELVQYALADLMRDGLLESNAHLASVTLSRRDAMLKLGARAAMLLPVVIAITAPTAAQAYSGCANCTAPAPNRANPNTDIFSTKDGGSSSGVSQ